ncbi:hypothetical protein KC356_g8826 [Hortaea werneckii]|nr:hypothetical protein KC356_g8826 [Hortaea werneckii]KAI7552169.1 hypothetical protein KC331_g2068 [Hortaea werneckii]KAI7720990.1 hypothetical protein KC353_g1736 [Hortaea werneckii]
MSTISATGPEIAHDHDTVSDLGAKMVRNMDKGKRKADNSHPFDDAGNETEEDEDDKGEDQRRKDDRDPTKKRLNNESQKKTSDVMERPVAKNRDGLEARKMVFPSDEYKIRSFQQPSTFGLYSSGIPINYGLAGAPPSPPAIGRSLPASIPTFSLGEPMYYHKGVPVYPNPGFPPKKGPPIKKRKVAAAPPNNDLGFRPRSVWKSILSSADESNGARREPPTANLTNPIIVPDDDEALIKRQSEEAKSDGTEGLLLLRKGKEAELRSARKNERH